MVGKELRYYRLLNHSEETEESKPEDGCRHDICVERYKSAEKRLRSLLLINLAVLFVSVSAMLICAFAVVMILHRTPSLLESAKRTSSYCTFSMIVMIKHLAWNYWHLSLTHFF
jgi:hypothetical protein